MTKLLEGKVGLVTGSSSGIGQATALAAAREGATVIVNCDKNIKGGEDTVARIKASGGEALFIRADMAVPADIDALFAQILDRYGRLDFAVNNAGGKFTHASTIDHNEAQFDWTVDVNLKGVWLCMKHEIPQMLKQGGGKIVNTSSLAGLGGIPDSMAYVVSKHGVIGLTKVAAIEYAAKNILINAVCPGLIVGEQTNPFDESVKKNPAPLGPSGRFGKYAEVAETNVWLCSEASKFVTGQVIAVDGGKSALQIVPDFNP